MPSPRASAIRLRAVLGRAVLCSAAVLWVAGCAKNPPVEAGKGTPAKTAKTTKRTAKKKLPTSEGNCISPRAVTSFKVIDRSRIVVNTYPQRVIELYDSCDGVRFMEELVFAGTGGIICDYRSDALIVKGVRCPIASIKDYEADADAELRKEIEGATPEGAKAPKKEGSEKKSP